MKLSWSVRARELACLWVFASSAAWAAEPAKNVDPDVTKEAPTVVRGEATRSDFSESEREILSQGEISDGSLVAGGLTGTFLGLGIGHAIEGRYSSKGYIFTVGEVASYGAVVLGAVSCINEALGSSSKCSSGSAVLVVGGLFAFIGFRIWEIIDVWVGPSEHNRRYRELKRQSASTGRFSLYAGPVASDRLGVGLQISF